jgi:hypothetical protein
MVTALGKIKSVKVFDDNKKGQIVLRIGTGDLTLNLSNDHEIAFAGMVALASAAVAFSDPSITPGNPPNIHVEYDTDNNRNR